MDALFDESSYTYIFWMFHKDCDLNELSNWRPIALLSIFYKILSKLIYERISSYLFSRQSFDSMASLLAHGSRIYFSAQKLSSNTIWNSIWNSDSSAWIWGRHLTSSIIMLWCNHCDRKDYQMLIYPYYLSNPIKFHLSTNIYSLTYKTSYYIC